MNTSLDRIEFTAATYDDITVRLRKYLTAELYPGGVPVYRFDIFNKLERNVGNIEFRAGASQLIFDFDGHIGYAILKEHRGNNYAYKAVKAIMPFLAMHELSAVILSADFDNEASNRIIVKLGGKLQTQKISAGRNVYHVELERL